MPKYQVELDISGFTYISIESDNREQAEDYAKDLVRSQPLGMLDTLEIKIFATTLEES